MKPPAIVILGAGALATARRIQRAFEGAQVHALQGRVDADVAYTELGAHLRDLYARGTPIVALCAAGIVIRCIATMLADKGAEPPVLAVAEDGSAVVPLLGGLAGVNVMAREIAATLAVAPAITTSGELRFGTCVLNPPEGYALADIGQGKRFVSDLLAGESTRIEGDAPWLDDAALPRSASARLAIRVTPRAWDGHEDELVIHPRSVVVAVAGSHTCADGDELSTRVLKALDAHGLAALSLAALLAPTGRMTDPALAGAAARLNVPLRFAAQTVDHEANAPDLLHAALRVPYETLQNHADDALELALALAPLAIDPATIGQARGRLTVIGLGPGHRDLLAPAARRALDEATDLLGYTTYVEMAGPLRADQRVHGTDNREEMQRARHAFELASTGRSVVMVSSGDPGVFAMAAAVLEALEHAANPAWDAVDLSIVPGISAAMATAALAGAPLGHDFCMLSLSDNLKPWSIIETRLRHAAEADLAMAFYNPISRARPWQLDKALDIVRQFRSPATTVVLGRDVGRPGGTLRSLTLGELNSSDVDMRTMVIIGSSTTRRFARSGASGDAHDAHAADGAAWVYTPRSYPA
ncbi:precorrin-3B C(17)-methyltransferase [Paraburkholderia sp. BCC1886]|uniref:precorrin-3B C(17)-methyltransferase n=1 Tax=Paraburkholderia sp. BCC1886 TaxID=2562670 RepID=UPI0011830FAF|nr:precorrin-3B C(17)-methyltransferase [Paraburkholderia sp. BCC1886]